MARVELVTAERAPLLARPFYAGGDPGPIGAALANVPELMEVAMPFLGVVYGPTSVPARLKEIVILAVSSANGCRYCTLSHTAVARRMGFAPDELDALLGQAPPPDRWDAVERALLAFSEALSHRPAEAVDLLRPHFGEPEIVELVTLGSATVMLNRFATALELPA
ncbi:MAG TPA: carboxymuconolactone decarboxylase family protein [Terriglobales bacterium]|nr:carboxymuconolactone decarboxylase family protein [Terriglobales bacterium]